MNPVTKEEVLSEEYIRSIYFSSSPKTRYSASVSYYSALMHVEFITKDDYYFVTSYLISLLKADIPKGTEE